MIISNCITLSGRVFISTVVFVCASEIVWLAYQKYQNYQKTKAKLKPKTEVFFFSDISSQCRAHLSSNIPCLSLNCPVRSLQKITTCLLSTKRTLDICIYFLTFPLLVREIINLKKKNIFVRVITDDELQENDSNQILNLRKAGIQIRTKKSVYLMHHKFAIIDKQILITGSANWTIQAFFGNCENLFITNQYELVNAYSREFETLWLRFSEENSGL